MGYRSSAITRAGAGLFLALAGAGDCQGKDPQLGDIFTVDKVGYTYSLPLSDLARRRPQVSGEITFFVKDYNEPLNGAQPEPNKAEQVPVFCLNIFNPRGAGTVAKPISPNGPQESLQSGQYRRLVFPYQSRATVNDSGICVELPNIIARNLERHGKHVQLVNADGAKPTWYDDNGTPENPNDDSFLVDSHWAFQIPNFIVAGGVPNQFKDGGYAQLKTDTPYIFRKMTYVFGWRIDQPCGNDVMPCTKHVVAFADDPADGNDICYRTDLFVSPDFTESEARMILSHTAGQGVTLTQKPEKSPFSDRWGVNYKSAVLNASCVSPFKEKIRGPQVVGTVPACPPCGR